MIPRTGGACMMREVDGKKRGGVCTYEVSCCAAFPLGGGVLSMAMQAVILSPRRAEFSCRSS